MREYFKSYNDKIENILPLIESESVDIVLTDPPYLYLKNQKLDKQFDEDLLFREVKRVLKKDGFIVLFGRGTSFYRWNTILADLGFEFKEEIIWNKSHGSSPLMAVTRIHETVSIHTKGNGKINKVKVPYLEMKEHDIDSIIQDIKRMRTILKNPKSLKAVEDYIEYNINAKSDSYECKDSSVFGIKKVSKIDRSVSVMKSIDKGMSEKTIIRTDRTNCDTFTKFGVNADKRKIGDRACNVMQSIDAGMNEKSIIKQVRDNYSAIHPTQKPVRLLERLLALVLPKDVEKPVVLDTFAGSFSTGVASINMGGYPILIELDKEYYNGGCERMENHVKEMIEKGRQPTLF